MIIVYNKNKEEHTGNNVYYIGRGSIMGNKFSHIKDRQTKATHIVDTREEAIELYREYMKEQYRTNKEYKSFIDNLVDLDMNNETIYLGCFCKPKSCHGDIIVEFINGLKLKKILNNG